MTDAAVDDLKPTEKKGKGRMILGVLLALAGAAGGYVAVSQGLIPGGAASATADASPGADHVQPEALPNVQFVDLGPIIVSVNPGGDSRHLRFHAQLEVPDAHTAEVEKMRPRILDVFNGYLRALELRDLQDPLALPRMRGHLLRRASVVLGEGRVRDVLVTEFVLN